MFPSESFIFTIFEFRIAPYKPLQTLRNGAFIKEFAFKQHPRVVLCILHSWIRHAKGNPEIAVYEEHGKKYRMLSESAEPGHLYPF